MMYCVLNGFTDNKKTVFIHSPFVAIKVVMITNGFRNILVST